MQTKTKQWSVLDLIEWTTEYFKKCGISTARLDAELLLGHVRKKERLQLYLDFEKIVAQKQLTQYRELVTKRFQRIPVSYLINNKEFRSLDFYVDENVLIPRPETEVLVETVLKDKSGNRKLLDIGTGSGVIAISIAKERDDWEIFATDLLPEVIEVAKRNARKHGLEGRINFLQGDLFKPINSNICFDWIVSNPPYIAIDEFDDLMPEVRDHEPRVALDGGEDGLDLIRSLIGEGSSFLGTEGKIAIEIGVNQGSAVKMLLENNPAYTECDIVQDYSDNDRVIVISRR